MKRINSYLRFLILGLWLLGIYPLYAEDLDLERIVVTASRMQESQATTPRKIDVVTAEEMEITQTKTVADALDHVSTVSISHYGDQAASKTIRMRGSTAAQVLVLIDGRPINNPRDGEVDLSLIPATNIERIELLRGAASNLYGTGAMAGTVNIITQEPPREGQKTSFTSTFATHRSYSEKLTHGARIGDFGYLLSAQYETSEGFRDNAESRKKGYNTKFEYALNNENKLTLNTGYLRAWAGRPGRTTLFDSDDKQRDLKNFVDANWRFQMDEETLFSTKLYHNYDRLEFIENTDVSIYDTPLDKKIHTTKVLGVDSYFQKKLSDWYAALLGFNYIQNLNDSTATAKHEYRVRAWYMENEFTVSDEFKINLSGRLDDYSNFGTKFNPSLSLFYELQPETKLHFMVSRSFRAPTFNDLYWPDEGWAVGNPLCRPEKSINAEVGIDTKINSFITTSLIYHHSDYNQLINWADDGGTWKPTNVGSAIMDGVESDTRIRLTDTLSFDARYAYLRAKDDKTKKYLVYQPKHRADWALRYQDTKGLTLQLQGQFTDTRFYDSNNTTQLKRFFVMNISAAKKWNEHLSCFLSINNLLNEKYEVLRDYPMPGFSITHGIKLEF